MKVFLWLDGAHDAPENMARDAALLERAAEGSLPGTVLRLFTFDPPGITLGRSQEPREELDIARLERAGVRWANRPTGGRAIWHESEWTFSLVSRLAPEAWAASAGSAYERTSRLIAGALARLGVPARLSPGSPRGAGPPRSRGEAAPPCFASTARHELTLGGRKLAGIAQRAVRGALLQQGSLLLGETHAKLALWVRAAEGEREALAAAWRSVAAAAGPRLGPDHSLARLACALAAELAVERGVEGGVERLAGEVGARALGVEILPRREAPDCLAPAPPYTARRS